MTGLPKSFDELGIIGDRFAAAFGVGFDQQIAAEDLRRLRFPQAIAADSFGDVLFLVGALERGLNRRGENRGAVALGRCEDGVDPRIGDARPGRVVDGDKIDFVFHLLERSLHACRCDARRLR